MSKLEGEHRMELGHLPPRKGPKLLLQVSVLENRLRDQMEMC